MPEDVVNLLLDIGNQVDVAYNRDLEGFLAAIYNDSKHKTMVRV